MKFIELKNSNQMAIVDASMYDWLNQFAWYACTPSGKAMYARATVDGSRIFMHRLVARVVGIEAQTIDHINGMGDMFGFNGTSAQDLPKQEVLV